MLQRSIAESVANINRHKGKDTSLSETCVCLRLPTTAVIHQTSSTASMNASAPRGSRGDMMHVNIMLDIALN
jgi:hypothetical protein